MLPWFSYVPTPHDDANEPRVLDRIRYRRAVEGTPAHYKLALSRAFAAGGEFAIAQGNHAAHDARGAAPAAVLDDVGLAHFPVRSIAQIQGKALVGWCPYLAMGHDSVGYGWHQRRLFHKLESSPVCTQDDLYEIARRYTDEGASPDVPLTYDPLPPVAEWRYGNTAIAAPMHVGPQCMCASSRARCRRSRPGTPVQ